MSASMFTNQQLTVVGVIVIGTVWYLSRKAGAVVEGAVDNAVEGTFGFDGWIGKYLWDTETDIELTPEAQSKAAEYVRLGYMRRDENGVLRITPAGEAYIEELKLRRMIRRTQGGLI